MFQTYTKAVERPTRQARGRCCRVPIKPGRWDVHARLERFSEPAVLLLLREKPRHGYELLDELAPLLPGEVRPDFGNLYRMLRTLEEDGLVKSEWRRDLPGPARRIYRLTRAGSQLLDGWVGALGETQGMITAFVERYQNVERR